MPTAVRREALRELLRAAEIDALLVTNLINVRYLTGFTGSNAALVVHASDSPGHEARTRLATDGRYTTQAAAQVPELTVMVERSTAAPLVTKAAEDGVGRLGFESDHVTVDGHARLSKVAAEAPGSIELHRTPGLVQKLRQVKDGDEVAALRAACAAADAALAGMIAAGGIRPGRTEREVGWDLEALMREHGADGPSFETIVAAGANSAVPHHRPTDAVLAAGDFVKLDFGALVAGYHSDMTRTLVLGEPADWQQQIYELVAAAQAAGRDALAAGTELSKVDAASRDVINAAGHGEHFGHGLGHGVGLEIHEAPSLSATGPGELQAGMVVTVEPGVYLAGQGGVRIEDTLVVRDGEPELLTLTTKELLTLPV
ncbi:MAG: aminopeptidase family protein [Pseudonocardia sp.]|nr:aminopeptidase family protein [Pseudonocardia sp.]